jgi:hypothetical protein
MDVSDPVITHDLVQCGSLVVVGLQHATNNVPAFPRQDAEKAPRSLDDFLALTRGLGGWLNGRCLFASRAGRPIMGSSASLTGLLLSSIRRAITIPVSGTVSVFFRCRLVLGFGGFRGTARAISLTFLLALAW